MKVLNKTPLTLAQVNEQVKKLEDRKDLQSYLKKFSTLSSQKSESLVKDLSSLNNPKLKLSDIIKVSDFLPKDAEEVNKIFTDVSLSEEEINQVLDIVKKYGA
jgi:DNA-directed RNA polymerase subunit F